MRYYPNPRYNNSKGIGRIRGITFSKIEIKHLFWAWIGISIAFGNIIRFSNNLSSISSNSLIAFGLAFILSAITVGSGFLIHELCHKIVAQKYGLGAEFRASYFMLFLAIIISFSGIVFAAPGAVMILGNPTKKQNGIISVAGPWSNIVLALLFGLFMFIPISPFVNLIMSYGFMINILLAVFNMLPFWILDGKKVLAWNKLVYGLTMGVAVILFILFQMISVLG